MLGPFDKKLQKKLPQYFADEDIDLITNDLLQLSCDFFSFLIEQKGYSNHTVSAYKQDLQSFFQFLFKESQGKVALSTIINSDILMLRSWLAARLQKKISPRSNARAITSLRTFANFFERKQSEQWLAIKALNSPRYTKSLPRPLPKEDIKEIINYDLLACKYKQAKINKKPWLIYRNIALITLIYATGLRISEALAQTKADLDAPTLRVIGKGNKMRILPLLPIVQKALGDYYTICPFPLKNETSPFFNSAGTCLQIRSCQKMIEEIRYLFKLPDSFTPHALRHSFATDLLNNGGGIRVIQELLGHVSLSSTQGYTKIEEANLLKNYEKFHPKGVNK